MSPHKAAKVVNFEFRGIIFHISLANGLNLFGNGAHLTFYLFFTCVRPRDVGNSSGRKCGSWQVFDRKRGSVSGHVGAVTGLGTQGRFCDTQYLDDSQTDEM